MTGMNMQLYAKEEDDSEAYIQQTESTSDLLFDAEETEDEDVPSEDEEETDEGEINPEEEAAEE